MSNQTEIYVDLSEPYAEELLLAEMRRALTILKFTRAAWDVCPSSAILAKHWADAVLGSQKTFAAAATAYKNCGQVSDIPEHTAINEIAGVQPVEVLREFLDGVINLASLDSQGNDPTKNLWVFQMIFPPGVALGVAVADIVCRVASAVLEGGAICHPEISKLHARLREDMNAALA